MDQKAKNFIEISENRSYFINLQIEIKKILNFWIKNSSCDLRKGNKKLKVDYFVPLKRNDIPENYHDELLSKISALPHIRQVIMTDEDFLCIKLNRTAVYKSVLTDVENQLDAYGMLQLQETVLVLTCDSKCDLQSKRNCIISDHIISLLCSNGVQVFHTMNGTKCHSQALKIECSDDCITDKIDLELLEKAKLSPYINPVEDEMELFLDVQRYVQDHGLHEKYSKISVPNQNLEVGRAAKIKHIIDKHMHKRPDLIVNVAGHNFMNSILRAGLMIKMLDNLDSEQVHIFSQSVKYEENVHKCFDNYVSLLKNGIETSLKHKYGSDVGEDAEWLSRINRLVDSTIKLDFLKTNPNVCLSLKSVRTNDKNNGVFVQYNYARLSNLFRNFESKVEEGYYFPLPCVEEVDFSLLRLNEEFNLLHYVMTFPKLVGNVLGSFLSEEGKFLVNRVCLMLFEMSNHLSIYYSRVRILGGQQNNLQQQMHARLWLLKGVFRVFQNSFTILNIEGLDLM